ncbi:MAG: hypothetical protein A2Y93_03875 [Chloroflexi bacterium RBG_13_68_17]|nr:MAG: hypothetical protein A2Y93_03875 [Chloroflexi bacterium RBG_13_68_17]
MGPTRANKVGLVTGVTAGIGRVTARELARAGMDVIGIGRNPQKATAVEAELRRESQNEHITILVADLSSLGEVRRVAGDILERAPRLDVLINNAGGYFARRRLSRDGIELTLALNLLSPFLLTNLLLDPLCAAPEGRVINVSSDAHMRGRMDFDDLECRRRYPQMGMGAYGKAKLGLVMFTYELARRLAGRRVTANVLHPGFVASEFAKNNGALFRFFMPLLRPFALGVEQGAETSIYLATSPEVAGVTGEYFVRKHAVQSAAASYNESAARQLWEVCAWMTGLEPRVSSPAPVP